MLILLAHFLIALVGTRLIIWVFRLRAFRPAALLIAPFAVIIVAIFFDKSWLSADIVGAIIGTGMSSIYSRL